jgi:hypothetical protein
LPTLEQLRDELDAALEERRPRISLWKRYYDGDHRLQFATSKFRETFGELFGEFATNWCGKVVDVAVGRLRTQGFRFGHDEADDEAWAIWQANDMVQRSRIAYTEAIKCETAYLHVGPPRRPGGQPVMTVESPFQVICKHDPADRRIVLAALKKYLDTNGDTVAVLWTDDFITEWRQDGLTGRVESLGVLLPTSTTSAWRQVYSVPNPVGMVPIVPMENNPDLIEGGRSDLKPAVALNDAANKFFTDMIIASEFTSFPQRILTGVDLEAEKNDDGTMKTEAELLASVRRIWAFEDPAAKVFQLNAGDLSSFVEGIDLAVQHLASQTDTPPHMLLAKLANVSGDALVAAETGLNARCRGKHTDFGDPETRALRIAFKWRAITRPGWVGSGDDLARSEMDDAEVIWADPESKDPVSLAQSLTMKQAIGVPQPTLWEEAGYSPKQITRMLKQREEQAKLMAQAAGQDPNAPGPNPAVSIAQEGASLAIGGLPGPAPDPAAQPQKQAA